MRNILAQDSDCISCVMCPFVRQGRVLWRGTSLGTMWLTRGPSLQIRTDSSQEEGWAERQLRLPTERKRTDSEKEEVWSCWGKRGRLCEGIDSGEQGRAGMNQDLYEFSIAAIKNHHQFSGLKHHQFTILQFWRAGDQKLRYWQGCAPSEGFSGESVSLPFLVSRGYLHSLACGPFLPPQSQQLNILKSLSLSLFSNSDPPAFL